MVAWETNVCLAGSLIVELAKRSSIAQHDTSRTGEFDGSVTFKICKRTRNRFHRQSEVVGDVLSRHWQFDIVSAWNALSQFQQKADHSLFGAPDQQQDVVLKTPELLSRHRPQFVGDLVVAGSQGQQSASLHNQDFCIADGLS